MTNRIRNGRNSRLIFPRADLSETVENPFELGEFSECVGFFGHQAGVPFLHQFVLHQMFFLYEKLV